MSEISRAVLFGKLNGLLIGSLENATAFCKLRGNPYVELAHWIHQLLQHPEGDWQHILRHFSIDAGKLGEDVVAAIDRLPRGASSVSDLSEHIDSAVERAWGFSSLTFGAQKIRGGHLMLAMLNTNNLNNQLRAISPGFAQINAATLQQQFEPILARSSEKEAAAAAEGVAAPEGGSMLEQYGSNLTEKARRGELDPVTGRDDEIRQIVDILMRRRQNNPLLTGEAGVGKTAVVEGLATRIAAGDVPPKLRDVTLYQLDMGMLQAGSGVRGEFEQRLRAVIDEVQSSPSPIILFVDEVHTLIGAGGTQGTGDAANLMKPALARGQLRTIGATTWSEYKKYIEKDPALTRRFQVVQVLEPDEKRAVLMLRHLRHTLEQHHQIILLDEAVEAAVRLSHRYIPDRQLPDKAISLLDTACARVAVSQHAEPGKVEHCRRRIEALETELDVATRDARIGAGDAARPAAIEAELEQERRLLETLNARWHDEVGLVSQIIELRARLYTPDATEEGGEAPDEAAVRAQLDEQLQQLAVLQGEDPLIFPSVDANTIASVVSDWTGIPLGRMMKNEVEAVLALADTLNKRVIGQKHGLELIARRLITSRASLDDPNKPIGVFMLCGPSGVGKTETAHALAESFYGGERNVITINMSEFQESHTVSTLKGAPPGYVGYGEGGVLTEAVRRRPYSVILLDEVEKAHTDVHEIFYQVFDKGWMEDGEGLRIDFRNTIIILTSNVGSDVVSALCADPALLPEPEQFTAALREPLLRAFPAALLGRLIVIPYYPLSDAVLGDIVRLQLSRIRNRLQESHQMTCSFDDEVIGQIVSRCTEVESGGRMVDTILTNTLLPQISHRLLTAGTQGEHYRHLHIGYADKAFTYDFRP